MTSLKYKEAKKSLKKRFGRKLSKLIFGAFKRKRKEIICWGNRHPDTHDLLSFAEKWLEQWKYDARNINFGDDVLERASRLCEEFVRRSFSANDIVTQRVSPGLVEAIAKNILQEIRDIVDDLYRVAGKERPKKKDKPKVVKKEQIHKSESVMEQQPAVEISPTVTVLEKEAVPVVRDLVRTCCVCEELLPDGQAIIIGGEAYCQRHGAKIK